MAHSRFEPIKDGVKFMPVRKSAEPPWSKRDFEDRCAAMEKLVKQLKEEVVAKVKPAKKDYVHTYVLRANTPTISLMGSPAALLLSLDD
jgi:hypothetical protein